MNNFHAMCDGEWLVMKFYEMICEFYCDFEDITPSNWMLDL